MRYSYSKIRRFRECPRAFRYEYIDRVEVEDFESVESFMGRMVHKTLEILYATAASGDILSLEDVISIYEGLWQQEAHAGLVVNARGVSVDDYRLTGVNCLIDYYKSYKPFSQTKVLGTEVRVKVDLLGDGRYLFYGFVDRLDMRLPGRYEIHDYKTGMKISEGDWQLALYELGIRQKFSDAEDVDLVWHYLRHNREVRCRKTHAEQISLKKEILSTLGGIEDAISCDFFPAVRTRLCAWCPYNELCVKEKKAMRQAKLVKFFI